MGEKYIKILLIMAISVFTVFFPLSAQEEGEPEIITKKAILYVLEDSVSKYQIGIMEINGTAKRVLTKSGNNWAPAVSPDGQKIAFYSDRSGFANLWVMDHNGRNQKQLTYNKENIIRIDLRNRGQIEWDKESKFIFFIRTGDIWKIDTAGETPTGVTLYHDITSFRMSPDKSFILFSREKTKRHNGLWTMQVTGINPRQVAESGIINPVFDWSVNKTIVYFHNKGISTVTYYGTERKFIRETFYLDNDIAWCRKNPDISQNPIAFLSDEKGVPNIWLMDHDGKNPRQVTDKGGFSPFWFPDGENLLYVEDFDIYKINIAGKNKERLTYYFRSFYPMVADIKTEKEQEAK